MPGSGAAPIDAAQGTEGPRRRCRATADIIELATWYGRYGYRRIAALLRDAG